MPDRSHATNDSIQTDLHLIEALREYIPHVMESGNVPGLNVAVARRNAVMWEEGFGYADLKRRIPMTAHTVTRAGSISKLYTGIAVLQLVEQGLLDLHTPAKAYFNDFDVTNPLGERDVTIYDLLTFRSGLATDMTDCALGTPLPLDDHLKAAYARPALQEYGGVIPRWSAKVGEQYQYSNLGIATLGYLVELANRDGLPFPAYVQQHILDPLGMESTTLAPVHDATHIPSHMVRRLSTGYARFGPVLVPTPNVYSATYPATGIVTTPGDHVRLLLALCAETDSVLPELLKPSTIRLMLTPQVPMGEMDIPAGVWNGLGVMLMNLGEQTYSFGHAGTHMWGWWNESRAYPNLDLAVAVFTNRWEMLSWHNPGIEDTASLVCEFAARWLMDRSRHDQRRQASWAWKTSYVIGLTMGERLAGTLGIVDVPAEVVEAMAREAEVVNRERAGARWDRGGFRAGVDDMLGSDMTPTGIRAFLRSDRLRVAFSEVKLINSTLGGLGDLPVPLIYWPHISADLET